MQLVLVGPRRFLSGPAVAFGSALLLELLGAERAWDYGSKGRTSTVGRDAARDLIRHVESGQHIAAACDLAGIPQSTVYHWASQGRQAQTAHAAGQTLDESQRRFLEFLETLARAREGRTAVHLARMWSLL